MYDTDKLQSCSVCFGPHEFIERRVSLFVF